MNQINAYNLLQNMNQLATQARGFSVEPQEEVITFRSALTSALSKTNDMQTTATTMAEKYEKGDSSIDVSDVMVNLQKASVSFQALVQVRNRLISAYQDIMNMHI